MDFVDYEAFLSNGPDVTDDGELALFPQPQPALALPLASNIENIGKRISSLNTLTRTLWAGETDNNPNATTKSSSELVDEQSQSKYANLSLSMLNIQAPGNDATAKPARDNASSLSTSSLSERLGRVLSGQLNDTDLRDIFTNLQDRFGSDPQFFDHLVSSAVPGSIARKSLRGRVHRELIKSQGLALKEYEPAVLKIRSAGAAIDRLKAIASQTSDKIDANYSVSRQLDTDITALSRKKTELALKKALLSSCKLTFTLDEYSQHVLAAGDIDHEFFSVLERAETVSANCSVLLSLEDSLLGLKLLGHANTAISKSVERILQFTNKTLANLYSLNVDNRLQTLHQCLRYLKNRLNYLEEVVDTFSHARSQKLLDDFASQADAVPRDSSEPNHTRPIFVSAHDPVRYLGDLLAYIHSLVVNEQETIESVFSTGDEKDAEEFHSIVSTISERVLLTLAQPLEARAQRILLGETTLASVLALYNLLDLYAMMLGKQLAKNSALLKVIHDLIQFAQDRFATILGDSVTAFEQSATLTPLAPDLQAPEWLIEFYAGVLPNIDQATGPTILNVTPEENARLLELVLDKPIQVFESLVHDQVPSKRDQLIARLNFYDTVLSKTMPLELLRDKVLELSDQMYALEQALRDAVLADLLELCKMHHFYNVCNMICPVTDEFFDASIYFSVGENKMCDENAFIAANEAVRAVVPSALLDVQQQLLRLNSPRTVNEVLEQVFVGFTDFYYKLGCIAREIYTSQWSWLDTEIATMLGVEVEYIERKVKEAEQSSYD